MRSWIQCFIVFSHTTRRWGFHNLILRGWKNLLPHVFQTWCRWPVNSGTPDLEYLSLIADPISAQILHTSASEEQTGEEEEEELQGYPPPDQIQRRNVNINKLHYSYTLTLQNLTRDDLRRLRAIQHNTSILVEQLYATIYLLLSTHQPSQTLVSHLATTSCPSQHSTPPSIYSQPELLIIIIISWLTS